MSASVSVAPARPSSTDGTRPALPPGPRLPRALQTVGFFKRHGPFMERCERRFGDIFAVRLKDGDDVVLTSNPDTVEQIFKGDPRVFRAGEGNRPLLFATGETSVFQLDGPDHLELRKLMLPAFHGSRLQRHEQLMTDITAREVAGWAPGQSIRMWPRMEAVTLEIIMRVVFGVHAGERFERLRDLLARRGLRRADELLYEEIRRRREAPDLAERDDVMSMLIQARYSDGRGLSDQQVRDQMVTLLIAGHETTAATLCWAIERLVRHPEVLERLHAEGDGDDAYVDAVVKETLRLRPVIENVLRKLSEPAEVGGHLIPAGTTVTPSIYLVHRRPDVYPEPRSFRPERFLERPAGTYTWIPFGGGTRRCLGGSFALLESKKILKAIVARVQLSPLRPEGERPVRRLATVRPERDGEVLVAARTNGNAGT